MRKIRRKSENQAKNYMKMKEQRNYKSLPFIILHRWYQSQCIFTGCQKYFSKNLKLGEGLKIEILDLTPRQLRYGEYGACKISPKICYLAKTFLLWIFFGFFSVRPDTPFSVTLFVEIFAWINFRAPIKVQNSVLIFAQFRTNF